MLCRRFIRLFFFLSFVLLTGCAASVPVSMSAPDPETPYPPARAPRIGDILHLPTGFFVTEEQMLETALDARIVYLGETHDNPASHRLELSLLRAMAKRYPGRVALGMEMFTPEQQEVLDSWIAGELNEKDFLRKSGWFNVWRMDFDFYRDLLVFARDHGIPVIGLNAGKDMVRAVSASELAELPEEQRKKVPDMELSDPYQRAMTEAVFGDHAHGNGQLESFQRVQTLWDETMAQSVAHYLTSPEGEDRHMLVVAGGNHIRYGFGIPRRVFRRLPTSYVLIGSREIEVPEDKRDRLMDIEKPEFPMPPYHFINFIAYEDLEKKGVKLGVMLAEEDGNVLIQSVLPDSNAARAGLQKGDIVIRFDEESVQDVFDIVYAVKQKSAGETAVLEIERDGNPLRTAVELLEDTNHGGPRHGKEGK